MMDSTGTEDQPTTFYREDEEDAITTSTENHTENHTEDSFSRGKDTDSNSHSFVTLSPPNSPEKGYGDEVDPSVLESLDGSTSSNDQPKSKLDNPSYVNRQKMLDMESPIAPGRGLSVEPEEGQDVDLKVEINDRLKHTTKNDTFISYKICTDTTRSSSLFERPHYEVWRRYKDFEWLRDVVEKTHYTLITPPLPGKQISRYFDHRSEKFLDERQKALDKFLKRLAAHPYFSFDKHFKIFLTGDTDDFTAHVTEYSGSSLKLLDAVSLGVKNATTSFMLKNNDPAYIKHAKYFAELGEKFGHLERVAVRLHTDREELSNSMEDLSSAMIKWATHEPNLAHTLQKLGTCVEANGEALKTLNQANAYSMLMSTREYQLYCAAGVNAVRRRDALQYEKDKQGEEREKRKKFHDDAAAAGKVQKLPKLAEDMQKASLGADKALDDLSKANEMLRVDIEKWGDSKDREMCSLIKDVASNHITYHEQCLNEWETVLKLLKSIKTSVPPEDRLSPDPEHRPILIFPGSLPSEEPEREDSGLPKEDASSEHNGRAEGNGELEDSDSLFS